MIKNLIKLKYLLLINRNCGYTNVYYPDYKRKYSLNLWSPGLGLKPQINQNYSECKNSDLFFINGGENSLLDIGDFLKVRIKS